MSFCGKGRVASLPAEPSLLPAAEMSLGVGEIPHRRYSPRTPKRRRAGVIPAPTV